MKNRGAFQISFPWLFAILVGIVIIFLAIYGVTKLIRTEETVQDVQTSKEIGILLNPLETGFEEAKSSQISFPVNTRVFATCNDFGNFGEQKIQVSQQSFNKWTETNIDISFQNKYIFAADTVEGKKINVFSKPFNFPFKVSDLMYLTSTEDIYCFDDAPDDIQDEIENLNQENLLTENCPDSDIIKVCFEEESGCNVLVNYGQGFVEKSEGKSYFESDALMYAAIFSSKENYECQITRLMKRLASLIEIYEKKNSMLECSNNLEGDLSAMKNLANNLESSADLFPLKSLANELNSKNKANYECRLW